MSYVVNGKPVSREEFLQGARGFQAGEDLGFEPGTAGWPRLSNSAGVHPAQIEEAMAKSRKAGCALNFNERGQAIIESPGHQRQLRKLGIVDLSEREITSRRIRTGGGVEDE